MNAISKMKAFGLVLLEEKTGNELSVLYRWIKAMEDGRGIKDGNKRKLIAATEGSAHAITWDDFNPDQARAA